MKRTDRMQKWRPGMTLAFLGTAAAGPVGYDTLARALKVPVHFASHQLCSATFVGSLDPDRFLNEAIKPKLGPLGSLLRYDVDHTRQEVRTSLAGLAHSH